MTFLILTDIVSKLTFIPGTPPKIHPWTTEIEEELRHYELMSDGAVVKRDPSSQEISTKIISFFVEKYWLFYSQIISLFLITVFIICLGIFFSKKASHIIIFNLIIVYYKLKYHQYFHNNLFDYMVLVLVM